MVTKKRKRLAIILGSILVLLIAIRIALPYILLKLVNKELQNIPGYTGHVDDIDVALIRGAYKIKSIKLEKTGGKIPVPFFSAPLIDLSLQWASLFHGRIVGQIEVDQPILNFVKGPTEETSQTKIDSSWTDVVKKLMPLKLNKFEIVEGQIHYRDFHSKPTFDIYTKQVHILAENLSNAEKNKELLPSTITASADVYGGKATASMKMDALAKTPTFDGKVKLEGMNLVNLNNFIDAFAKFDIKAGEISIYTEAAAKNGKITGYTKPIIKNLKVLNWEKDKEKPLKIAYEAVVEAVAWIFKNHNKEQLATKVEFEGNIKNPNIDIWYLIGQVLKNAFIQALYPSLENSVNINSVDGGKAKDSPLQKEISNSGGIIKNKTEPKKTKKQLRQEKRAKKKAEKEKKKAEKEKQKKEDNK
ncbi:MAG TPA: DUF748 domain-containing protein [Puia sp.]|nr:DUF748 domain-containing protein [Puia sp.]